MLLCYENLEFVSQLSLTLLGTLAITLDGQPVAGIESDKVRALLVRLALEPERAFRREALSALLWPEAAPAQAAQNLRQALYSLRRALGQAFLLTTPQTVQFNAADVKVDALTWRRLWSETQTHRHRRRETCRPCLERLEQAVSLYRGDLLVGFALKDSAEFDDWLSMERERLHVQALEAFTLLANAAERRGDYPAAQEYVRRLLALEPWQEVAHRHLMRLLALDGRRAAALEQFEVCRRVLAEELGLEPIEDTRALHARIRAGEPLSAAMPLPPAPPTDLPLQLTSFIGREREVTLLSERLGNPAYRLITLTGPGGVGKTRLALQLAMALAEQFADGVCWVSLSDAVTENDLMLAIAHALRLRLSGAQELRAQLLQALRHDRRDLLLVLDNFEQLLSVGGATLVLDVLRAAPRFTLLVTSRERLNLRAESVLPLEGLGCALPAPDAPPSEAAQLFVERAGRARMDLSVGAADQATVAEICHLLEGSPLGIELAAAWAGEMSLEGIAEAITATRDFLASTSPDLPDRHRSLRVVFEGSWQLLSAKEQSALMRVSVFRGGFQAEAAQRVAGVSAPTLNSLARKSLLFLDGPRGRYGLHGDIRYYAAEKLAAQPSTAQEMAARHAAYFADLVQQREQALRGRAQQAVQAELEPEWQNVLAAWQWAIAHGDEALLTHLTHGLFAFCEAKSWFREGATLFQPALERMREAARADLAAARLLRRLLGRQAVFCRQLSQYAQAHHLIEEGLALPGLPDDEERAFLLYQKSWVDFLQGRYAQARQWAEASLERYRALGQPVGIGDSLYMLGWTAYELGDFAAAEALCLEARAVCAQADYAWGVQYAIYGLGLVRRAQGDYAAARRCFEENLGFCDAIGYRWGVAQARINLGLVALAQDKVEEAETHFQKSLLIGEQIGNEWVNAQSQKGLSAAALSRCDLPTAQTLAERSLALYQAMQDRDGMADSLLLLSQVALASGDLPAAHRALTGAEGLIQSTENGFRAARALVQRADILLREGDIASARALLEQALRHPACEASIRAHATAALAHKIMKGDCLCESRT
ncbi:BTAD domain-containing putative transcriptional regulator [Roseiflexus sp.]|uniref:ATP-binding protein n=1 Tax=Roseiflexus sp. TaxID=2562120 RepID=UPI0021DD2834|nr:BTAD domain-containing putative transcriptional regulator [Roseiflexus sp.]GIV98827.1 MAG: transcriptional activator [Roseiflexus sp.]